ncbi:MAG: hypothetical protein CBARDMAM_3235 [uncultured Caballeronia sp.]|nr:MAG: hypothetical protein CBARDMAM_3235 [uncultured Caballeronia sp.]
MASGRNRLSERISGPSKTPESGLKQQDCAMHATMKIFCVARYCRVFSFACHIYTQFLFSRL